MNKEKEVYPGLTPTDIDNLLWYIKHLEKTNKKLGKTLNMAVTRKLKAVEKSGEGVRLTNAYLKEEMKKRLIQQDEAIDRIIPYVTLFSSNLSSPSRPVGTFLLLGPTGTGKGMTTRALAGVLHEDENKLLTIDCGQYELSHEVAKLVGAPPGYLGHRETAPILSQQKINGLMTDGRPAIIVFDEIEKAHPTFYKLLLSILEKGTITTGDNSTVSFASCLVFLTSNLGADKMMDTINPTFGFRGNNPDLSKLSEKLKSIGSTAARKRFTPEFLNRIDEIIVYSTLTEASMSNIFDIAINICKRRCEASGIFLFISEDVKNILIKKGFSPRYGARELNRVLQRELMQPLANLISEEGLEKGTIIKAVKKIDTENEIDFIVLEETVVENAIRNNL